MVSRIQNRNTGYSENLFSHSPTKENNALNSIQGATALKLDESYELQEDHQNESFNDYEDEKSIGTIIKAEQELNDIPSGVSIESASYIDKNNLEEEEDNKSFSSGNIEEEYTPKLFSEEQSYQSDATNNEEKDNTDELFDQDINEEEDFEIPAFLRKQKF